MDNMKIKARNLQTHEPNLLVSNIIVLNTNEPLKKKSFVINDFEIG